MSIMTCPKCGGSGEIGEGDPKSTVGMWKVTCPSCGGSGYVTDMPGYIQAPPAPLGSVKIWIKCPHCGKEIEVEQFQGTYTAVKV